MKKKVLLVSDFHANVYGWRKEIIESMLSAGAEVALAVPYGEQLEYFREIGCKLFDVKLNRKSTGLANNFSLLNQYKVVLKQYKPDLALLYGSKGMLYTGYHCKRMGIPYFSNINGLGTVETMGFPVKQVILTLYKMVVPGATCVFFQNRYNMEKLEKIKLINKNYRLIPGSGVNTVKFKALPFPTNSETRFLFCARIMKEKGIVEFIEAARKLCSEGINAKFDVVGMYDDEFSEKLINDNKDILAFHGFQKDVIPFIENTNCVVLPSFYGEGISNSLLESAASARPIITTNMPGCRETVIDEKTGFIIEPQNSDSLYKAMKRLCKMSLVDQEKMGLAGREYISEKFSRDIVVKAYMEEYKKVFN